MKRNPRHRTRYVLWGAFLALAVALSVLLALQYSWLTDLEQTSAVARKAKLERLLGLITKDVRSAYVNLAEQTLNVHATLLEPQYVPKLGKIFTKKHREVEGVSRFFVVSFLNREAPYLLYDPENRAMTSAEVMTPELQAIMMAAAPWGVLRKKGTSVESTGLVVEERHGGHRILVKPITDEDSRVVGLSGLIVDPEHFRSLLLPRIVTENLPGYSPDGEIAMLVRDAEGRAVWPTDMGPEGEKLVGEGEITRAFSFLFTDWEIAIWARSSTPEQWARSNFALNVTLSLVLAAVLLGAVLLIWRTTAREMRLSEMKNDFVSNVSHELRTPLASIRVFGEFLRLGRVRTPEKVHEYGEYIETESRRLTQLINNILDFSRIESGRWAYELEPADLEEIVADVARTFEIRLRRSGFRLDVRGPLAPLPELRLDRDAIRQALFNLLDNAVKYSGDGRDISVRLERHGDRAVVSVRDHGIGVSRREREKIFERFHRVGTGLVHDVKGTGLGLAIVDHIVRAHGGEVRLDSEPGAGSTFSIHLPISGAVGDAVAQPAASGPREGDLRLQQSG